MDKITAWAIKAPDGVMIVKTDNDTEEKAWQSTDAFYRDIAKSRGYCCVRVTVTEVQE